MLWLSNSFILRSMLLNLGSFLKYKFYARTTNKAKDRRKFSEYTGLGLCIFKSIGIFHAAIQEIGSFMLLRCCQNFKFNVDEVALVILLQSVHGNIRCLSSLEIQREKPSFRGINFDMQKVFVLFLTAPAFI